MSTERESLLNDAAKTVSGDRDKEYGPPDASFDSIAALWTQYVQTKFGTTDEFDSTDVALMMTLVKISRLTTGPTGHRDSWLDIAGYAACGYEVTMNQQD